MTNREKFEIDFFKDKRPWSKIKDEVLGKYLRPYLAKVNKLGKKIVLIDTFAGPGVFEDGSMGSPLLMVQMAQKMVPNNYQAIFVNNNKSHHNSILNLFGEKSTLGNLIEKQKVIPLKDDAKTFLKHLKNLLTDQTVFLYLYPYGLKGCEINLWLPFLKRNENSSTEILINIQIPVIFRLSSRKALLQGKNNIQIEKHHRMLDKVFGGDYWKQALLNPNYTLEEAEMHLMKLFKEKLLDHAKYVGYCPVREKRGSQTKYYMVTMSNVIDGYLLMNDHMCMAYNRRMVESDYENLPLLKGLKTDWKENRNNNQLKTVILGFVKEDPGKSRIECWYKICEDHFMGYHSTEYRNSVKELCEAKSLTFKNVKGGKRLNDTCRLYLA